MQKEIKKRSTLLPLLFKAAFLYSQSKILLYKLIKSSKVKAKSQIKYKKAYKPPLAPVQVDILIL
jgi:hypothetical protein